MWTYFRDMHSGGSQKTQWGCIYIEAADEDEATLIFYNRFGMHPDSVTCTCCGSDYSVDWAKTLEELTAYERGCDWEECGLDEWRFVERPNATSTYPPYTTLTEYLDRSDILFLRASDIKPEERSGELPEPYYPPYDYE